MDDKSHGSAQAIPRRVLRESHSIGRRAACGPGDEVGRDRTWAEQPGMHREALRVGRSAKPRSTAACLRALPNLGSRF